MSGVSLYYDPMDTQPQTLAPLIDEMMVADARAGLTPSQMVERKLVFLLRATPLPVSCLQMPSASRAL
ncbi:MAG TPA: hypothetical protein VEL76_14790 [Gemmataceae bacterium]|nr:hypothetical protein [Gemmataceae bacterium]